jgi:cell division protein FtsQ
MTPVAAPSDRRFRRARLKPARRRGRLKALIWPAIKYPAIGIALIYAGYRSGDAILQRQALDIDHIVVDGNDRLSADEVMDTLDGMRGENIVWTDLSAWRQRLFAHPWVQNAWLRRSLPSTVRVFVSERAPMALGRSDGELFLIDGSGIVIDRYGPAYSDLDLPIVDGLLPQGPEKPADGARVNLAARLIGSLESRPDLLQRLSQVDVTDAHNAVVTLTDDPAVIYLGEQRFLERLRRYVEIGEALKAREPEIDYADMRLDDRIIVRPPPEGRRPVRPASRAPAVNRLNVP